MRTWGRACIAILALSVAWVVMAVAPAQAGTDHGTWPTTIDLPDGFQPEGIAIGDAPVAYIGSLVDGDIYAADLRTGTGRVVSVGPGTPSVGMKLDHRGRLFVAGGTAGDGRVLDVRTGAVQARWAFATGTTFVNDVVLTGRAAWFTDSSRAVLYGVHLGKGGTPGTDVVSLPLGGQWEQVPGFNANGIAATPDRQALLVVNSATGRLYRVDPETGVAERVDLGDAVLTAADGLLRNGRTLYVVQNRLNQVTKVLLNREASSGRVVESVTAAATPAQRGFDVPTTVAAFGHRLYLPNARFGTTTPTPQTEYWLTAIRRF